MAYGRGPKRPRERVLKRFRGPNPGRFTYKVYDQRGWTRMLPYVKQRGGTLVWLSKPAEID